MAAKRKKFTLFDSSSDEEDSHPHTMTVNAVVHRNESNVCETQSSEADTSGLPQFLEQSSAGGNISVSDEHSVINLSDDPPITTVPVPQFLEQKKS